MSESDVGMGASVHIQRRVQWMDTDAAGIWHHATIIRWTEEAEAELHRTLGILERTFGATPRVHVSFDFKAPVRFDDLVDVTLRVAAVGGTSVTYAVDVEHSGHAVATGRMVAVLIDTNTGRGRPWPPDMREALLLPSQRDDP